MRPLRFRLVSGCTILISVVTFSGLVFPQASGNATSRFLGSRASWSKVSVAFHQMSPLFGGLEVFWGGDGAIILRRVRRSETGEMEEVRYQLNEAERVQELLRRFEEADLVTMELERELPPPLDSGRPLLVLRNASGEQRVFEPSAAPSAEFEKILSSLISLEGLAREAAVVYQGTVDAGYYPAGYGWVQPRLEPRRDIRWAPHADGE
ncbi:hypothetical protein KKH27_00065 [bacterium]|nr:hypothetical protein [bacterium]MBU1984154.1 hypothetical protein [bacterium]